MVVLLLVAAVCLGSLLWIAVRNPVAFRLGIRNVPRRRAQTILIVIGLMLSTMIIAASLGTGDTVNYSGTAETYRALGTIDELVVASRSGDGEGNIQTALRDRIPESLLETVTGALEGTELVDAIMGVRIDVGAVLAVDATGQPTLSEPQVYLIGLEPAELDAFGGLRDTDGTRIDVNALAADEVAISSSLADQLDVRTGDPLLLFLGPQPTPVRVGVVAEDSPFTGRFFPQALGIAMPLDRMQELTGTEGELTAIAISNQGGIREGVDGTDAVEEALRPVLTGQPYGIDPVKQRQIELSEIAANIFTSFFIVFGLFSIAVGVLLIILIFSMLAAERRTEMGITRAVGAPRSVLVQQFVAEGGSYAVLAGLVGVVLGGAAAYAIAAAVRPLLGGILIIEPHVTLRSMVVAYCLGVTITFLSIVAASWRISRLNIVTAIRDIPDVVRLTGNRRLIGWGALLTLVGVVATTTGQLSDNAFAFYLGMSLMPFGVALLVRYLGVPGRIVFTLAGALLMVLWLIPPDPSERLWGELNGGIELFFLSGVFMVAGATVVLVQNLGLLLRGLTWLGDFLPDRLPAIRMAVAFPSVAKGRTGLTIAMFSLIVFSLVVVASINENFTRLFLSEEAGAGWDVRIDTVGNNPLGDVTAFEAKLAELDLEDGDVTATGRAETAFQINMRRIEDQPWKVQRLVGVDDSFLRESTLAFQQRATGYESDEAIVRALLNEPDAVVLSSTALAQQGGFGQDPTLFRLTDPDGDGPLQALDSGTATFDPIPVQVEAATGGITTVRVIGIIDGRISTLLGMLGHERLVREIRPNPSVVSYLVRLQEPAQAMAFARQVESALVVNGAQGVSIEDELEKQQRQSTGFLLIFQGFMGLGLIVGVAAVGVIALRSVVERRQQIGVLRAIGFQRALIRTAFLVETAFVVGLGVLAGVLLGVALSRNLFSSEEFTGTSRVAFQTPWPIILVILVVTVASALGMAVLPARQAARLAPAEALRYE